MIRLNDTLEEKIAFFCARIDQNRCNKENNDGACSENHSPCSVFSVLIIAQSAGDVEYTDCFSAEGYDPPPNECPGYGTKQSDGEVPVILELWVNAEYPLIAIALMFLEQNIYLY